MIRIGIIGAGLMARTYAETLAKYVQGCQLVAIAVGARASQLAHDYGVAHEPSLESLAARPDVDGVILTTPDQVRVEQARVLAQAHKHLLVEKPMAPDVAQCDALINICREAGVLLMQVQSQRYRAIHQRMKQLLNEGRIGRVWMVRVESMLAAKWSDDVLRARPFYLDPMGSNLLTSQIVHNFDMMRWVAGSNATRIFAHTQAYNPSFPTPLSIQAQVMFANSVSGQLWVCMETPNATFPNSTFHTQVIGAQGLMDFDGYTHLDVSLPDGQWERVAVQEPFDSLNPVDPVRLRSFTAQNQEFVDAIREQRAPAVTGADGRAAVELAQAAFLSSRTGQVVSLPLQHNQ